MKVKKESEKVGLTLNIQKIKIMASGPITSWQIDGETMETVTEFVLGAPKSLQMVTAAMKLKDTCSLEREMATHSRTLAWKIPWMEEPDRLQFMGLQRVRHN